MAQNPDTKISEKKSMFINSIINKIENGILEESLKIVLFKIVLYMFMR